MTDIPRDTSHPVSKASSHAPTPRGDNKSDLSIIPDKETRKTLKRIEQRQAAERSNADKAPAKDQTVEARVTKHSSENPRDYTVKTPDGEITLRSETTPPQRPPVDQAITIRVSTQQNRSSNAATTAENKDPQPVTITLSSSHQTAPSQQTETRPLPDTVHVQLQPLLPNAPPPLQQSSIQQDLPAPITVTLQSAATTVLTDLENTLTNPIVSNTTLAKIKAIMPMMHHLNAQHSVLKPALFDNIIQQTSATAAIQPIQTTTLKPLTTPLTPPLSQPAAQTLTPALTNQATPQIAALQDAILNTAELTTAQVKLSPDPQTITSHDILSKPVKAGDAILITQSPQSATKITTQPDIHTYQSPYSLQSALLGDSFLLPDTLQNLTAIADNSLITLTPITHNKDSNAHPAAVTLPPVPTGMNAASIWGPLLFQAQPWDNLQNLHQALIQAAPQQASALSALTPSTSSIQTMIPAALFFLSAIKGGDISEWLGEKTIEALQKSGKSDALNKLTGESDALHRMSREPSGEWRTYALPLRHHEEFHKILLHTREEETTDDQKQSKGKFTRFLFDLSLDHIGDIQLDGLFSGQRLILCSVPKAHSAKPAVRKCSACMQRPSAKPKSMAT